MLLLSMFDIQTLNIKSWINKINLQKSDFFRWEKKHDQTIYIINQINPKEEYINIYYTSILWNSILIFAFLSIIACF